MDIILYNIGLALLLTLIGYFIGSIPNSIWIGKVFFHKDPRDYGSGNAGGTNAGRIFGKKIGVLVIFLDAMKVVAPIYITWYLLTYVIQINGQYVIGSLNTKYIDGNNDFFIKWPIYWMVAVGCFVGHCLPIYANFKGGKNASSFAGLALGTSWFFGLLPGICFFTVLKLKKYVSLSSITASWFGSILSWIWAILIETNVVTGRWVWFVNYGSSLECNYVYAAVMTFAAILLTIFHRANIKRLINGTERKISWMK